jgi:hypothetical protein
MPNVPGKEKFKGEIMHSIDYRSGDAYMGKHAIVVGVACSGHDIAADLYHNGAASVTMIQRNPTMVFPEKGFRKAMGVLYNENGPPLDYADRLSETMPSQLTKLLMAQAPPTEGYACVHFASTRHDNDAFSCRLQSDRGRSGETRIPPVGARPGAHHLRTPRRSLSRRRMLPTVCLRIPHQLQALTRSRFSIVDGNIGIKSGVPLKSFTEDALTFEDGTEITADVVVFATGYVHDILISSPTAGLTGRGCRWVSGIPR